MKRSLRTNYVKFCTIKGCKQDTRDYAGLHELHDLSIVALSIYKVGVEKSIISPIELERITEMYKYAIKRVACMNCEYSLKIRKKMITKVIELKQVCTSKTYFNCVLRFAISVIMHERTLHPSTFEWPLLCFIFNMANSLNQDEYTAAIGFFIVLSHYNDQPSALDQITNFPVKLYSALRRLKLWCTPMDYAKNQTSLPNFDWCIEHEINIKEMLVYYAQLFAAFSDDEVQNIIRHTNDQIQYY